MSEEKLRRLRQRLIIEELVGVAEPAPSDPSLQDHVWNRTQMAVERFQRHRPITPPAENAPHGRIEGRPIIGHDMPNIIGGVSIGSSRSREAIIVDDQRLENRSDVALRAFFDQKFLPQLERKMKNSKDPETVVMDVVYNTVRQALRSDSRSVKQLVRDCALGKAGAEIHLATFVQEGVGVCRHHALLAGYLVARLKTLRPAWVKGDISIERNSWASVDDEDKRAHGWLRYTPRGSEPWIVDVTHGVKGRLSELMKRPGLWEYARPHERREFKA